MKVHIAAAVALVGASFVTAAISAQTAQTPPPAPPPMTPILAGKKITPPIRGQAEIDIVKAPTKREGTTLVTKIQAKNISAAPIARLRVVETWYDKSGGTIPGGEAVVNGLLQPNEIQTLEIRTPVNLAMSTSQLAFSHANGTIKAKAVKSFDAPADSKDKPAPAAKTSTAKKK
jgi:hypothetical protein